MMKILSGIAKPSFGKFIIPDKKKKTEKYEHKMASVYAKYVSRKVSRIRWRPMPKDSNQDSDVFAIGTWDDKVNNISLWTWKSVVPTAGATLLASNDDEPKQLCQVSFAGDVTDIKYLNEEMLAVASSKGEVSLYKHNNQSQELELKLTWNNSHRFRDSPLISAPCTALDACNENLVSVGEDGRLVLYTIRQKQPLRTIAEADSCTITAVAYLKQNEVISSNMQGQFKIWDLRSDSNEPVRLMILDGEAQSVMCVARHPTQTSILACGTEDGSLCIWDLRNEKYPLTNTVSAHHAPMLELKFHPTLPNHLFTCSMDGMLWHWNSTSLVNTHLTQTMPMHRKSRPMMEESGLKSEPIDMQSPWLLCGASKHHLDICSLIPASNKPVNSLDILDNVLVCGTDNEAIYVVSNLNLK